MQTTTLERPVTQEKLLNNIIDSNRPRVRKINTKFGEIEINLNNRIVFHYGLLGLPNNISFCLSQFPQAQLEQFSLLQAVEDDNLCFIVAPAYYGNNIIEDTDIDETTKLLEISRFDLVILFLVSAHEKNGKKELFINAKAPIFVDNGKLTAIQYVLPNQAYQTRHLIS